MDLTEHGERIADVGADYDRGLNLFDAPGIDDRQFVGREEEVEQMRVSLTPDQQTPDRKVLVLGGMGGIGKTQLAISYAKKYRRDYTSVFWLNATSETTLKSSLRLVARRIAPGSANNTSDADDDQTRVTVLNWLSELGNTRWLLILDNYDEPDQYPIGNYYPYVSHGSILITSRLPDRVYGGPAHVAVKSCSIDNGLEILSRRSERDHVHKGKTDWDRWIPKAIYVAWKLIHLSRCPCSTPRREASRSTISFGHSWCLLAQGQEHMDLRAIPCILRAAMAQ